MPEITPLALARLEALDDFTLCDAWCELNHWNWHPALPWKKPDWWERGRPDLERKGPYFDVVHRVATRRCGRRKLLYHHNVIRSQTMSEMDFEIWWLCGKRFPWWYERELTLEDSPRNLCIN